MALTQYQKKALRRITANYTDTQKDEIGSSDAMALNLIDAAKERELANSQSNIAIFQNEINKWQLEKEIWENV